MSCDLRCQLTSWQSYIWFKNGKKVHDKKIFYPKALRPEDQYSCAISGNGGASPAVCEFIRPRTIFHPNTKFQNT